MLLGLQCLAVANKELWLLRCSPLPANHPKPMESSSSMRKSRDFLSREQSWWLHHQKQDSCCFVHKNPRYRTSPSSACSIIPFGLMLILLVFVKHCKRLLFNGSHLKEDICLYSQLGLFPTSWECSLHTKVAHLTTNLLLRKAASFPGAPEDCISSAGVLESAFGYYSKYLCGWKTIQAKFFPLCSQAGTGFIHLPRIPLVL